MQENLIEFPMQAQFEDDLERITRYALEFNDKCPSGLLHCDDTPQESVKYFEGLIRHYRDHSGVMDPDIIQACNRILAEPHHAGKNK